MSGGRRPLGSFLARNPFEAPYTLGFFYREKMRAIHRVAPETGVGRALEVGGGRSGLTRLLYPDAEIVTVDLDASFAKAPCNRHAGVRFLQVDATALPFADASFDLVTQFDLLEHIPDDVRAAREAVRVLRPGGVLLVSTPHTRWRYPWYGTLSRICPSEDELFAEWGHVRRGYDLEQLAALIEIPLEAHASFISGWTALSHDLSFSRLSRRTRRILCAAIAPLTWVGYALHRPHHAGTETATAWRKRPS